MVGRPALADEIKKIRGTAQPCRTNPGQPAFTKVIDAGEPPEHLGEIGRSLYKEVTTELITIGILQTVDISIVILLCDQYEDYYRALELLKGKSGMVTNFNGDIKIHPAVRIKTQALANILKLVPHLGLSPASRQRIKLGNAGTKPQQKKSSPFVKKLEIKAS